MKCVKSTWVNRLKQTATERYLLVVVEFYISVWTGLLDLNGGLVNNKVIVRDISIAHAK